MTRTLVSVLFGTLLIGTCAAQGDFHTRFENDLVAVYELNLAPHLSASSIQAAHDTFWVALNKADVSFARQQDTVTVHFDPGDVRYFPSFDSKLLTNSGTADFRGVLVAIKPHALISTACECTGNTGRSICGCKGATHLESLWALGLGNVTLAGTSLGSGEAFRAAAERDDMLLVAVTDLELQDEAAREDVGRPGQAIHLKSGEAVWITGGRHQFKNLGAAVARFVTVEF